MVFCFFSSELPSCEMIQAKSNIVAKKSQWPPFCGILLLGRRIARERRFRLWQHDAGHLPTSFCISRVRRQSSARSMFAVRIKLTRSGQSHDAL
jgi:hypothetical protein